MIDETENLEIHSAKHEQFISEITQLGSQFPELVMQLRNELYNSEYRKRVLYERTLGLAVVPLMLRRAFRILGRKLGVISE